MSDTQLPLFANGDSRYQRFKTFHHANPGVFGLFRKFAEMARRKGRRKHFGARMIGERIRWYTSIEIVSEADEDYKVNDHYWPYYARLLMLKYPDEFTDFFERRDRQFDVDDATLLRECG